MVKALMVKLVKYHVTCVKSCLVWWILVVDSVAFPCVTPMVFKFEDVKHFELQSKLQTSTDLIISANFK